MSLRVRRAREWACAKCHDARVLRKGDIVIPCVACVAGTRIASCEIPERYADAPPVMIADAHLSRVLIGPAGRGKTRYAVGVLKQWCASTLNTRVGGGLFCDLPYVEQLRREAVGAQSEMPGARYVDAAMLVADDLCRQDRDTPFWLEWLSHLVRVRYNEKRPTVWTTNRTRAELAERLGEALVGRIFEDAGPRVFRLTGRNWRAEEGAGG